MLKLPLRLLLVEDSPDQRELIGNSFYEEDQAVQITEVEDGPACLEALSRSRFDAIILDYSLPRMNGLEVLRQIKERAYTVPVVMVTGQGDERIAVEAMKRGAYDYIIKSPSYLETLPVVVLKAVEKYQLKSSLEKASLRTRQLYEVSLSIAKERKLETLATTLMRGARQLMKTQGALFFLIDPEREEITMTAFSGIEVQEKALLGPVAAAGLLGLAYTVQQPVVIEAPDLHPRWGETPTLQPQAHQLLSVPLIHQEKARGVLTVLNKEDEEQFSPEDLNTLSTLAVHATVAIENARFLEEIERQAITDSLTGLYNHREFQKRLSEEVERGNRYGKEFSLLMLDIDHFKVINDTHGHPVGDAILKQIAKIIQQSLRTVDIPARYGGEEFATILPETNTESAKIVAERICQTIADHAFATPSGHSAHLSVSIGVASFPLDANSREQLIAVADQALYFSKEGGRNRVCLYASTLKSAIERDKDKLAQLLRDPQMKTLRDLAMAIDAKTPYTRGHTEGVLKYAILLAEGLSMGDDEKKSLHLASLLHNIGMVSIPDRLMNKPGPLSVEERKVIQAHPILAEMLIKGSAESAHMDLVLQAILYHHERYDGNGYPNGLRGEEIPFLARVLGIVEAYHAMVSVRPYRPKLTQQQAIEELRRNAGSQFDPRVVEAFVNVLNRQSEP